MPASPRAARTDPKPLVLGWQTGANLKLLHPQPLLPGSFRSIKMTTARNTTTKASRNMMFIKSAGPTKPRLASTHSVTIAHIEDTAGKSKGWWKW
jgi:hypothetical protein